jgi:heme A synthase
MLTAVSALCAWFGAGREWPGLLPRLNRGSAGAREARLLLWVVAMLVVVSMAGAVTALGDTLFPVSPTEGEGLLARIKGDLSLGTHFLVRLRVIHPILAVAVGIGAALLCQRFTDREDESGRLATWTYWIVWAQMSLGAFSIALGAPGWMQLLHLLLAQVLWLLLVLLYFSVRTSSRTPTRV